MKTKPEVSVAVSTYNMEGYLRQLLDSILMQKVDFPYEMFVDDDCSPDNSRAILLEYQKQYSDKFVLSLKDHNEGGSGNIYGVLKNAVENI